MPYNGSGIWTPPAADFPAVSGTLILASHFNNNINDVATAFDNCVTRDGQSPATASLPMGGFRHINIADGSSRASPTAHYASLGQVQDNGVIWGGVAGGTADALTLTLAPVLPAYTPGQVFYFQAGASPNTGAATIAINGLLAKSFRLNGAALIAGDIEANKYYKILYDGFFHLTKVSPNQITGTNSWTGVNTFVDSNFQILGSGDATKKMRFEADGIATATTRVITVPDADISLANWSTGDVKLTFKTVADATWVLMDDGTIGSAASGATTRANADTVTLYTLLWNNTVNADCAVSTGRGANAAADYAANKTIALPKALGRALAGYGTGSGLTARALAHVVGEENHQLSVAELASHTHVEQGRGNTGGATTPAGTSGGGGIVTFDPLTTATGSDTPHNTMQPTVFLNVMIKL